jgi:hypothetical protein
MIIFNVFVVARTRLQRYLRSIAGRISFLIVLELKEKLYARLSV